MGKYIKEGIAVLTALAMLLTITGKIESNGRIVQAADYGINNPRIADDGTVTWDKISFGSYYQSVKFNKQPIKWRILSVNEDGTDAFVMSDRALDCKRYNDNGVYKEGSIYLDFSCTWETSTIRSWLNNEFLNEAFSAKEQAIIHNSEVVNDDNPRYGTDGGNNTIDKAYLLSDSEIRNDEYGYSYMWKYNITETDYAKLNGSHGTMWLRSPGQTNNGTVSVGFQGNIYDGIDDFIGDEYKAVCPVMHIDLTSGMVEDAGEVDSYNNTTQSNNGYNNPVKGDNGNVIWDCVYFGNYNQDGITDKEPIEWRVLSVEEDDVFLMSDKVLDNRYYNEEKTNGWENCSLRKWLNESFIAEAFNDEEKKAIKETAITNKNEDKRLKSENNTLDEIYLLSLSEINNESYGFVKKYEDEFGNNSARCINETEYAFLHGNTIYPDIRRGTDWWLRTSCEDSESVVTVNGLGLYEFEGEINGYGVCDRVEGVCPVMHINLNYQVWNNAGTVSVKLRDDNEPTASPSAGNEITPTPTVVPSAGSKTTPTPTVVPSVDVAHTPIPTVIQENIVRDSSSKSSVQYKIAISSVKCKKNTKKITGKVSVTDATVKITVGKKKYKAKVKGKSFTLSLSKKLKKKTKITIKVTKKNYKTVTKKYTVK